MFTPSTNANFYQAVQECKDELKRKESLYMMMQFKDLSITVSVDSNPDDLATIYDLKKKLQQYE